jgi:hypothetical protein
LEEDVRETLRKHALTGTGVAVCLAGAIAAFLLALDVAATSAALRDDDVRYRAEPQAKLWSPPRVLPGGVADALLGVEDDVLFRRALRATRLSHPERPGFSDPSYVVNRNDATAWLTDLVQGSSSDERRSAAASLLGVLSFSDAVADYSNRETTRRSTTSS